MNNKNSEILIFFTLFSTFYFIYLFFEKLKLAIASHLFIELTLGKYILKFGLLMINQ